MLLYLFRYSYFITYYCASTELSKFRGKFTFPWHWRSNTIYGDSGKLSSHIFRDTDDPTTIYDHSGKLCRMLSMTLTIQQPYMAIQENFATCCPWHWWSNNHIYWISDTIENFCGTQELVRFDNRFLSFILVKWRSNKRPASVGLAQACPNYKFRNLCMYYMIFVHWFT